MNRIKRENIHEFVEICHLLGKKHFLFGEY